MSVHHQRGPLPFAVPTLPAGMTMISPILAYDAPNLAFYLKMGLSTATNWYWNTKHYQQRAVSIFLHRHNDFGGGDYGDLIGTLTGSTQTLIPDLPAARTNPFYGAQESQAGATFPVGAFVFSSSSEPDVSWNGFFGSGLSLFNNRIYIDPSDATKAWVWINEPATWANNDGDSSFSLSFLSDGSDIDGIGPFFGTINLHINHPFENIGPITIYCFSSQPNTSFATYTGSASGDFYVEQVDAYP